MEETNREEEFAMAEPITLSAIPNEIDCTDLEINSDECFENAYRIAEKYPETLIVEGLILMRDKDNGFWAVPHVWNKSGDCYFDVTNEKTWEKRKKRNNIESINYFLVQLHTIEAVRQKGFFEFCFSTTENIAAIKDFLFNHNLSKN